MRERPSYEGDKTDQILRDLEGVGGNRKKDAVFLLLAYHQREQNLAKLDRLESQLAAFVVESGTGGIAGATRSLDKLFIEIAALRIELGMKPLEVDDIHFD